PSGSLKGADGRPDDDAHRAAEHRRALHAYEVLLVGDGRRRRRQAAPTGTELEEARARAVTAEIPRQHAELVVGRRGEDERGCAVTEQDAGAAVERIDEARERLGTDDEHVLQVAGGEHRRPDDELV